MGDDETRKAFLKGFEDGLKAAWREIASLMTRGYSSTELMVFAKSKMAVLYRDVEAMEARLIDEEGIPVVGGGEITARKDLRRRGAYLVREPKAERVFELFVDLLRAEARGLCITRIHPDDARSRYGIGDAGFIWLSKSAGQKGKDMATAEPTALVDIASAISEFAADGGNAVELAVQLEPDVVLIDIGLPGIDGYEVARQIRSKLRDRSRLIALSGYGQQKDRHQAFEAGFDEHLLKPCDPERLTSVIASLRGGRC